VHLLLWGYSTLHSVWKLLCNYKPELLVYGNTQQGLGTFTVFVNHDSQRGISLNQWWIKLHAKSGLSHQVEATSQLGRAQRRRTGEHRFWEYDSLTGVQLHKTSLNPTK
jgi:hypothetical protein